MSTPHASHAAPEVAHAAQPPAVAAIVARLRSSRLEAPPAPAETPPVDGWEVARRWVDALGAAPGSHLSPVPRVMAALARRWAESRGWGVEVGPVHVGTALAALGCRRVRPGGRTGYVVGGRLARQLEAEALEAGLVAAPAPRPPRVRTGPRPAARKPPPPAPLFPLAPGAVPLLDSLGRVWPSSRVAASRLRTDPRSLSQAARGARLGAAGLRWRQLAPEEVAYLPPSTQVGQQVALCFPRPCLSCAAAAARAVAPAETWTGPTP